MQEVKIMVAGTDVDCYMNEEGTLAWPKDWTQELTDAGFLDAATDILAAMPSSATQVPWIIGSGRYTLFGTLRSDSASHMEGRAFDMSPMRSPSVAIEADSPISGLAWNLMDLLLIAQATNAGIPFVVEGDHIHVQPDAPGGLAPGQVYCCWTFPDWYTWTSLVTEAPIGQAARNTVWLFDLNTCVMTPPSQELKAQMLQYLTGGTSGDDDVPEVESVPASEVEPEQA